MLFLSAVVALFVAFTGCDSDDFATLDDKHLTVTPNPIIFAPTEVNGLSVVPVSLKNDSPKATLTFTLQLEEARGADGDREMRIASEQTSFTLEPGRQVTVDLEYFPKNDQADSGVLKAIASGGGTLAEVEVQTGEIVPDIDGPARVLTGRVPAGATEVKDFFVQNVGLVDLELTSLAFASDNPEFSFCAVVGEGDDEVCVEPDALLPHALGPYERQIIRLSYTPTDDTADRMTFLVESNDPDENPFEIEISANGADPCVTVTNEDGLDFGRAFIGGTTQRTMTITNCSPSQDLAIDSLQIGPGSDPEFSLAAAALPALPATIPINSSLSFVVDYAPTSEDVNNGTLVIESNDSAKTPLSIPLTGQGTEDTCPPAVATATVEGSNAPPASQLDVSPLDTLRLDASASNNGNPASYQWTVVERPPGSNSTFSNPSSATPTFFIDLAGVYRFEVEVTNQNGTPSCRPAQVVVTSVPGETILVELVWDAETDLDLHFKRDGYDWEDPLYDCYYSNDEPNWNGANPSLDIDDTNGFGPENINLDDPASNGYYNIGVYAYRGSVTSRASIRVFFDGAQVFESLDKLLDECDVDLGYCDMWHAADIDWANRRVVDIDRIEVIDLHGF